MEKRSLLYGLRMSVVSKTKKCGKVDDGCPKKSTTDRATSDREVY